MILQKTKIVITLKNISNVSAVAEARTHQVWIVRA
jgi:hypothetical protein